MTAMGMYFGAVLHSWPQETNFGRGSAAAHCQSTGHDIKGLLGNKSTDCKRADNTELPPQPSCHLNTTQNTLRDTSKHSLAIVHFSAMHFFGPLKNMAFRA